MGEPTEEEAVAFLEEYTAAIERKHPDDRALAQTSRALAIRTLLNSLAKHKEALEPFKRAAGSLDGFVGDERIEDGEPIFLVDKDRAQLHDLTAADFRRASNPGGA